MTNAARFRDFIARFAALVEAHGDDEARIFRDGAPLLMELVRHDDWLPAAFAQPAPDSYRQYLLYCDPLERFSVVSFVWGPGQKTPVHDHTVWGMVGVMRGAELCQEYGVPVAGQPLRLAGEHRVSPGGVDKVSPTVGDVHVVANALGDRPSISIHVYGANIGAVRRHVYDPATGAARDFVSGYHNTVLPNFWDRSAEVRQTAGA
jgi:predicted metal-dependent enzyme (double-stranded beta helix superfamily)